MKIIIGMFEFDGIIGSSRIEDCKIKMVNVHDKR